MSSRVWEGAGPARCSQGLAMLPKCYQKCRKVPKKYIYVGAAAARPRFTGRWRLPVQPTGAPRRPGRPWGTGGASERRSGSFYIVHGQCSGCCGRTRHLGAGVATLTQSHDEHSAPCITDCSSPNFVAVSLRVYFSRWAPDRSRRWRALRSCRRVQRPHIAIGLRL